jgi:type I restriction enzyme M protein
MSLSATIKTIQDIMRKDAGVDGDAQRIGQLVWMLFLKIFDDREQEWEVMADHYRSPIPEPLRWRNWAADADNGITGDKLLDFVNNDLFKTLKELSLNGGTNGRGYVVRSVFEDAYNYMKNGTLIRQVINKLNEDIDFNRSPYAIRAKKVYTPRYESTTDRRFVFRLLAGLVWGDDGDGAERIAGGRHQS